MKKVLLLMMTTLGAFQLYAQFSLTGEFRPRGELRRGYKALADDSLRKDPAILVSQRTRINVGYKSDKYKVRFSLQDVRLWGDQIPKEDVPAMAVYEAWLSYKLYDSLWLKLGRQELIFDDKVLMSNNNWNQNGQVHDALKLSYSCNKTRIELVSAYNNSSDLLFGNDYSLLDKNYKLLNMVWLGKKFGNINTNLAFINDGFQKAGTKSTVYMRFTYGGGLDIPVHTFSLHGRGFYQSGKNNTGSAVAAYYAGANITDTVTKKFRINAGIFYASGNNASDPDNKTVHAFDPLYGTNHGIHGNLDYFTSLVKNTGNAGLQNLYVKLEYACSKKTTLWLDYHWLMLQNKYVKDNVTFSKNLGSEIDLTGQYAISKEATLEIGYACMLAKHTLEVLSGGNKNCFSYWVYIMFTLKPVMK